MPNFSKDTATNPITQDVNADNVQSSEVHSTPIEVPFEDSNSNINTQVHNLEVEPSLESLERNILNTYVDPRNDQTTYQPLPHATKWTRAHPMHQIIRDPWRWRLQRGRIASGVLSADGMVRH
mgnify:CR=1 FL=1